MSSLCGSVCKSNACNTKIHYDEARYVWTIENFGVLEANGTPVHSPGFPSVTNSKVKWKLLLHPNSINANDHIGIFFYLSLESSIENTNKIFANTVFSILNEVYKEEYNHTTAIEEFPHPNIRTQSHGISKFVKKDEKFRNKILLNNTLRIRCEIKFSDVKDFIESCSHQSEFHLEVPECNFSENFVSLFENQELTDVIISTKGKDYPAHKTVLAARSPVFRAMFKHNTIESQLNRIDIEDINEAVVGEMLKYIYTGKSSNLKMLAGELLAAADKYDLYQLKMMSAKTLLEGLSVENAANVLALADTHGVKELKNEVIKFIASKPTEVLATEGWKSIRSNFELVDEVLCLALARRNTSMPNN
ncbi:speckle-type POZ protein B-like isoform X3 [Planococcus citri]|uniref:speckle-type POZ protein B-like isoform X3 n=1 Tax=Planococcus citri TaxID=170843 RepID=UPI0031F841C6